MMKRVLVVVLLAATILSAADKKSKHESILPDVAARGRALYEYDQAAWHGSDAVLAMQAPKDWHPRYIAQKTEHGWTLVFGVLNEQRDQFLIGYEATQGNTLQEFTARKLDPPREDSGFYLAAAKAIDAALRDFKGERRPYNVAVLPAYSDQLYVYVYPAQTSSDVHPLGGDVRYLIKASDAHIVERRQLHKSIIEVSRASVPKGATPAGGYHTHVLSDVPEDTDVFHVLTQQPPQPEFIGTVSGKIYAVREDGTIHKK